LMTLRSRPVRNPIEFDRREELERFFNPDTLGGSGPDRAWQLRLPRDLTLMGTIDPTEPHCIPATKILDRSLVLTMPALDLEAALQSTPGGEPSKPLLLPRHTLNPVGTWERFPQTRDLLLESMRLLAEGPLTPSRRMAHQVSTFLAYSESWGLNDGPDTFSHLMHLMVLPRLGGPASAAQEPLKKLLALDGLADDLKESIEKLMTQTSDAVLNPL